MALLEKARTRIQKVPIPKEIDSRLQRGFKGMQRESAKRNECMAFWRGEQYRFINGENVLVGQPTTTSEFEKEGKPPHVIRRPRNLIFDIVEHEVSASVRRIPSYEVTPSTPDPMDEQASRLSQQILRYGYDKWQLRRVMEEVVRFAIICDEGFAWPFFDTSIGPFMDDGEGGQIGKGDIRVRVFGPNEVGWENGVDFEDSRWHFIRQARDPEAVKEMEGYLGGELDSDAQNSEVGGERSEQGEKLVMVTEYLERPCPKYPAGRWFTFANERMIVGEREYPCRDMQGNVIDEPVLHRLSYARDPDSDRDKGLVRHLLGPQRTINNSINKQEMWVDLAMNPQVVFWNGGLVKGQRLTNVPGAAYQARGNGKMEWRPVPPMPPELAQMKSEAREDMAQISAQNDVPSQVESGKGIQALLARDESRRYNFTANVSEFYSRLGRHCLYLVQRHYTEERQVKVQGEFGADTIPAFLGSELRSQVDVTVQPGSIEVLSKQASEERILAYADRGWITPQAAMAAISGGTAESLIRSYQKDIARAHQIIRKIKQGPEVLFSTPPRVERGEQVEGWTPRRFDNIDVQMSVFEDWLKTVEFDSLEPGMQEAAMIYYETLEQIKAQKLAEQASAQAMMAESQGAANAAKPQKMIPTPQAAAERASANSDGSGI